MQTDQKPVVRVVHFCSQPTQTCSFLSLPYLQGIAPVVICQVLQSDELHGMQLSGHRVASVCLVVIVRRCERSPTKLTLMLEDHTGQITAHYWLDEGGVGVNKSPPLNRYARVYGAVRHLAGSKSIMLFHMEPLPSANALTNHLLEMLYARFKADKCAIVTGGQRPADSGSLNARQAEIFEAIKRHASDEGISHHELRIIFPNIAEDELK